MVKIASTGIRKINFKDCLQEAMAVAVGSLWQGPPATVGDWTVGLGAGNMPDVFQGMGGRHLVTATPLAYSPIYTRAPVGANDWWHTVQQQHENRYAHQYDVQFRVNTAWPGVGAAQGIAFGYFVEHIAYVEQTGYRVRIDGATLFLEKFGGGAWNTFGNVLGGNSSIALVLSADKDYYMRITYYPTDTTYIAGNVLSTAGGHVISITDDFERRGSDNILQFVVIDANPLLGGADTKLMLAGYDAIDGEFDLITYSEGFLPQPNYMHYYSQLKHNSTSLTLKWATPGQAAFDLLSSGDRVEMWCKSRNTTIDMVPPNVGVVTGEYNKILCVYDGMVLKILETDKEGYTTVSVVDEFRAEYGTRTAHESVAQFGAGSYYDYMKTLLSEYQGANADRRRITPYPGVDSTQWGLVNVSVAAWVHRGSWATLWEVLSRIVNVWNYWNPAGAFLVSQLAPIPTGKVFDLTASTGELQWIWGSKRVENRRDSYANVVNQYHDNGAGVVVPTTTTNAVDVASYGTVAMDQIDVNMPAAEGAVASANLLLQVNDKNDMVDIFTIVYGLEFHVGCKVRVTDSSIGVDESDMTITEVELFRVDDMEKHKTATPNSVIRFRLAKQADPLGAGADALPRYENKKSRSWIGKWRDGEYQDHNWT